MANNNTLTHRSPLKRERLVNTDLEDAGDLIIPLAASSEPNLPNDTDNEKGKTDDDGSSGGFWRYVLIMIVINVVIYHFITPAHVKTAQKKAMDEQLLFFSEQIHEQKASMEALLGDRTTSLEVLQSSENQTESLKSQTQSLLDQLTFVSKGQHKSEVGKLETDVSEHKRVAEDLEATMAKLKEDMKVQQATLEKLKGTIVDKDNEVKSLRASMNTMTVGVSLFCPDCVFNREKMGRVTCKGRADYLVSNYNTPRDDAIGAVMKQEPINCAKEAVAE